MSRVPEIFPTMRIDSDRVTRAALSIVAAGGLVASACTAEQQNPPVETPAESPMPVQVPMEGSIAEAPLPGSAEALENAEK